MFIELFLAVSAVTKFAVTAQGITRKAADAKRLTTFATELETKGLHKAQWDRPKPRLYSGPMQELLATCKHPDIIEESTLAGQEAEERGAWAEQFMPKCGSCKQVVPVG